LEYYRLLGEPAKVGVGYVVVAVGSLGGVGVGDRLALDARPRQVDIEEQEQDAEADDGGLAGGH
jgi:hypothetical protein